MKSIEEESSYIRELLERIVERCPRRSSTSEDERRAAEIIAQELSTLGIETHLEGFRFNESLYATIALHFGLGSAGTLISGGAPQVAFILHLLAAGSYYLDSTKRAYVLRSGWGQLSDARRINGCCSVQPSATRLTPKPTLAAQNCWRGHVAPTNEASRPVSPCSATSNSSTPGVAS